MYVLPFCGANLTKKAVKVIFPTSHHKALVFYPCPPDRLLDPMSNFTEND